MFKDVELEQGLVLKRIDPNGESMTRKYSISRRVYNVIGANHLWHIHSYHKLIAWHFVIYGCIDGFSRAVLHLACRTNNKTKTILRLLEKCVEDFGLLSRVREDHGVKNLEALLRVEVSTISATIVYGLR